MTSKYIKPKSLTWKSGVALVALGLAKALAEGYQLHGALEILSAMSGDVGAGTLIAQGMAIIGMRGAIK